MALLGVCLLWLGCGTTQDHRSRQYSRDFRELPEEQQTDVLLGRVRLGMSPEAVYVALGAPLSQGQDMSMPNVDALGFARWYYRGQIEASGEDAAGAWAVFRAQFDAVLSASIRGEIFVVDFSDRAVSKMWLLDREDQVLDVWE